MQTTKRSTYLDILKLLACFLVCVNHAEVYHWFLSLPADYSFLTLFTTTISILTTMNVPLYFMVTGAVLLRKEENYGTVLRRRVLRFGILLALVTLLKCLISGTETLTFMNWVRTVTSGSICVSYWFLYAYLGLLIMLPLLQRVARVLRGQDILMMIALRVIVSFLFPVGNTALEVLFLRPISLSGNLQLPFSTCDVLFYPLIGYYLANLPREKLSRRITTLCWFVLIGGTAITLAVVHYYGRKEGFTQNHLTLSRFLSVIAVFLLIRTRLEHHPISDQLSSVLSKVSSCTLGIYISESFLWDIFAMSCNNLLWQLAPLPRLLGNVLWCLFIMTAGCCITWLVRKLPGFQKLL